MKRKLLFYLLALLLFPIHTFSQEYSAKATIDSTNILIGDYLHVNLLITAPSDEPIVIPVIDNKILEETGLDWVNSSSVDTLIEQNRASYKQVITITSFDEGNYLFPAIPVFNADTILLAQTEPLLIEVSTIPVDTTAAFMDIKQPVKVPLTFKEIFPYVLMTLAGLLVLALIIFLILKYQKRQKPQAIPKKPSVKPEVAALSALERLRQKRLWEDGKVKLYYSELTEIVRVYIDARFEVNAMEMVSEEILHELFRKEIPDEAYKKLKDLLMTADLVKFAKWSPLPNDHERCFKVACEFVEQTTTVAKEETTDNQIIENRS